MVSTKLKLMCVSAPGNNMFTAGRTYVASTGHGHEGRQIHVTDGLGHTRVMSAASPKFIVKHDGLAYSQQYAKFECAENTTNEEPGGDEDPTKSPTETQNGE